jgi:hypothetical protein
MVPNIISIFNRLDTDLLELPMTVKFSGIIHFAEGFYFHMKGIHSRIDDLGKISFIFNHTSESASRFYGMAIEKFEEALARSPNNKEILLIMGLTYTFALEDEFPLSLGKTFPSNNGIVAKATEYFLRFEII